MWSENFTMQSALIQCVPVGCTFLPILLDAHKLFVPSWSPFLVRILLLVPAAQEIPKSLYLLIPFDGIVWSLVIITGFLFVLLMFIILQCSKFRSCDLSLMFMEALRVILFVALTTVSNDRNIKHFLLCLLCLFTGLFLTNFYTSSLWSLYTSKVYESELELLNDIGDTNLKINIYSLDKEYYDIMSHNLPPIIKQRIYIGDDDQFTSNRQNLIMTHIYPAIEDLVDYVLLQQMYLTRPRAIKLAEPIYYRLFFISMHPRTPFQQQFNRYLSRLFESGIFNKFIRDAQWDGLSGGKFRLFKDEQGSKEALTLAFYQYAFIMLLCGWGATIGIFLVECLLRWRCKIK
ncbi:uncharacterized protein LOC133332184 [Musca vetustissima]|uniref:uncharacterized protein LOC133332184 n=1 Tax=Musca vetustissima TaxID=27455 RepID=UPI002AB5DE0F|nr:uncharacterized protein LOC133332184 [Musca vetustissima]